VIGRSAVGIDILSIDRLERAIEKRPALASRLFTQHELDACAKRARPAKHLAGRYCVKEASIKALGLRAVSPADIEVLGGRDEGVRVALKGNAKKHADELGVELVVSLTHDGDTAAAVAMATPI